MLLLRCTARSKSAFALALASLLALPMVGCGAALAPYRPVGHEADALIDAGRRLAFAARSGETDTIAEDIDADGRDALLDALVTNGRDAKKPDAFAYAAAVGLGGEALFPDKTDKFVPDPDAALHAALEKVLETDRADVAAAAAVTHTADEETPPEDPRITRLRAHLSKVKVAGCAPDLTSISVHPEALGNPPIAPAHAAQWEAFRARVLSVHVLPLECKEHVALGVLAFERDRAVPVWLGWQFFTNAQFAALKPRFQSVLR